MRTIKFRGKRLDNELWVDGDLVTSLTPKGSMTKCPAIHTTNGTIGTFFVQPETIGQYTGLHDRSGKEIYEGDIIKITGSNEDKYVAYSDKEAAFGIQYPDGGFFAFTFDISGISVDCYEVIGNIHDNS